MDFATCQQQLEELDAFSQIFPESKSKEVLPLLEEGIRLLEDMMVVMTRHSLSSLYGLTMETIRHYYQRYHYCKLFYSPVKLGSGNDMIEWSNDDTIYHKFSMIPPFLFDLVHLGMGYFTNIYLTLEDSSNIHELNKIRIFLSYPCQEKDIDEIQIRNWFTQYSVVKKMECWQGSDLLIKCIRK